MGPTPTCVTALETSCCTDVCCTDSGPTMAPTGTSLIAFT
eukprot:gene9242-15324_t